MRTEIATTWADGLPNCKGKSELIRHLNGKRLTPQQVINAMCCRCSSGYDTGKGCNVSDCPGFQRNPYNMEKNKRTRSS